MKGSSLQKIVSNDSLFTGAAVAAAAVLIVVDLILIDSYSHIIIIIVSSWIRPRQGFFSPRDVTLSRYSITIRLIVHTLGIVDQSF